MYNLAVDGENWRYAFLEPDACLSQSDREYMLCETIRLYKAGDEKKNIKGEEFEGRLTKKEYVSFGACMGRFYEAELDTEKGKRRAKILVQKPVKVEMN